MLFFIQYSIAHVVHVISYNISKFGSKIMKLLNLKWKITSSIKVFILVAGDCTSILNIAHDEWNSCKTARYSLITCSVVVGTVGVLSWIRAFLLPHSSDSLSSSNLLLEVEPEKNS
jgi:hypothetical protein